ncbi:hypothetical protein CW362_21740 [Streptomyces populi]|uniref:DUF1963 domain-containing protein n=1 Tax=Streptomyces populi TaxID=2058924 RepID=A0A2I0SM13_9ACTN|nr:hypothetical protein CW362_21740 [Streptomyces populi]
MFSRPTGQATGPYDAAFLPRLAMSFRAVTEPVTEPVTKFGGRPVWLEEPTWPLDPSTGEPLVFIGQFRVPGEELRLAYLFLAEDDRVMGMDPTSGEAVVLVQPGGRVPSFAVIGPPGTQGRSLWRWGADETEIPVELSVDLTPMPPELDAEANHHAAWWRYMRHEGPEVRLPSGDEPEDFMGGTAVLPNGRAWGVEDDSWQFLCQFADRGEETDSGDPFFLNFGYGSGFVFMSSDHREGRFLGDCT